MGIGCSQRVSGSLWLTSMALGRDAGLALVYPSWLRAVSLFISVSQRFPSLLGYCLQCARLLSVRYGFPRYLWVSKEAYGRLPLFHLFSTSRIVHLCSSLTVPWIPLCISIGTLWILLDNPYVSLCITTDTHRYT